MTRFRSRWFEGSTLLRRPVQRTPRARLMLRGLEERCVPAVVTDAGDTGAAGQLRQVLAAADTNGIDDTITFQAGITNIALSSQLSLTTENQLLTIDGGSGVTISNAAAASATSRIFNFNVAGGNPTITLKNLTLTGGNLNSGNGGAILLNNDPLVCDNVTFSTNKTTAAGGAISSTSATLGTLTLTNCTFTGNNAGTVGGAIAGIGTLAMTMNVASTTFTGNLAGSGGGAINLVGVGSNASMNSVTFGSNTTTTSTGGAVNSTGTSSTVSFTNCSFTFNTAAGSNGGAFQGSGSSTTFNFTNCTITNNNASTGGGLRFQSTSPTVTIDSCTIANNTANGSGAGGGISNTGTTSPVMNIINTTISGNVAYANSGGIDITAAVTTITNSTISGNSVTATGGNGGGLSITTGTLTVYNSTIYANTAGTGTGAGGGIRKTQTSAVTLHSTIVAGNVAASGAGADISCVGAVTIGGGKNLIGVADVGNFTLSGINISGVDTNPLDPLLNSLGANGGPTMTHSLKSKSPAFNSGSNTLGLSFDQRGTGFPRVNGTAADVGAYEGVSVDPGAKATLPGVPPINPSYTATVVYSDETGVDTATIDTNDVLLSGPAYPVPVAPTGFASGPSGKSVTVTYTFTPPGGAWDYGDDGQYTLIMQPNQVKDTDGPNAVPSGALGAFDVTIALPNPLIVDNNGDTDDGNFAAGQLTLREAIRLSNATYGQLDSITFDASLSSKTITVGSPIAITDAVNITGLGAANLKISGGTLNQIVAINLTPSTDTVTLAKLTLADGNATAGQGGAITVGSGNLTLDSVTLNANQSTTATGAGGGAIWFAGAGKLTINNSAITNNTANGSTTSTIGGGGAIITTGLATVTINNTLASGNVATVDDGGFIRGQTTMNLTINDSTISNNSSGASSGVGFLNSSNSTVAINRSEISGNTAVTLGGGFYFNLSNNTFTAVDSTFSGNVAATGGALAFRSGTATFTQSTLSGNQATGDGGAIAMMASSGTLTLNNATVTNNNANKGGGIRKVTTSASFTMTLNGTIVAGNSSFDGPDIDCAGVPALVIGGSKNLVGVTDLGNFSLSGTNKTGTNASPLDPMLDALGNNGGPTKTHALKAGSPAFNNGSNVLNLTFDQRGVGFPRLVQSGVDIGAFEGFNPIPEYAATLPNVPPINATYTATVTYTDETGIDTGSVDVNDVRLSGPGYVLPEAPISATVKSGNFGDKSVTVEYVFTPPGGAWDHTDDGAYQLDQQANQVYDTDGAPHATVAGKIAGFQVNIPLPVLVVDENSDTDDLDYSTGKLSLREAINLANATTNTMETVTFAPSLNGQTITVAPLTITDPLLITGPGASNLTISGGTANGIFITQIAAAGSAVSISGLTIADGSASVGSALSIANENVTVSDSVIKNNANFGSGGAINVAGSAATLTVINSTFDANSSGAGGAITIQDNAKLLVDNSLFTNNSTTLGNTGGAIRFVGSLTNPVNVAIRNSTFTGNKSAFHGGAIGFQLIFVGTALVQNCTITGNYSDTDDNGSGDGGGVAIGTANTPGKVLVESSIVYGNFKGLTTPVANDVGNLSNATFEAKFSIIGDASTALNFAPDAMTTALLGQNPLLNSLANNGGPTQTMSLQNGSPAINNGSNPAGLTNDQRGAPYLRTSGVKTDIGAFEFQYAPTVTNVTFGDGTSQRSMVKQIVVTFSEAVNFSPDVVSAFTLTRTGTGGPLGNVTLTANPANGPASVVTITFAGPLTENGSLADGFYDLTISAAQVAGIGGALDGNNDGTPGGTYSVIGTTTNQFFRLYGDADGSGVTDLGDFAAFRGAFNLGPSVIFDFDNDGNVGLGDFARFRSNFNLTP